MRLGVAPGKDEGSDPAGPASGFPQVSRLPPSHLEVHGDLTPERRRGPRWSRARKGKAHWVTGQLGSHSSRPRVIWAGAGASANPGPVLVLSRDGSCDRPRREGGGICLCCLSPRVTLVQNGERRCTDGG